VSESLGVASHTNNRAEMQAIIRALEIAMERRHHRVLIRTDCELIVKIMNEWLQQWKSNNWRRVNNGPIKNLELIQRIDNLCTSIGSVSFEHIKGTSNKKAHILANQAMKLSRLL
jgi:ribonuclease HI